MVPRRSKKRRSNAKSIKKLINKKKKK